MTNVLPVRFRDRSRASIGRMLCNIQQAPLASVLVISVTSLFGKVYLHPYLKDLL